MVNVHYGIEWLDRLEKSQDPKCRELFEEIKKDADTIIMLCNEFFREMEKSLVESLCEFEKWKSFDKYLNRVKSFKLTVDHFFPGYLEKYNMYEVCDKTEYYKLMRHIINAIRS